MKKKFSNIRPVIVITLCLLFGLPFYAFSGPGIVTQLKCDSGHNDDPNSNSNIAMSWSYPESYSSTTISFFYYALNTSSEYTISTQDSATKRLDVLINEGLSGSDNIKYYFHIAAMDKIFNPLPDLGPTTTYGPMRIDNVPPTGASVSGPENTCSIYNNVLELGASGATTICISNQNYGVNCSDEIFVTFKSWTLTEGFGEKVVYVQFKDIAGNTATASTSITYTECEITKSNIIHRIPSLNTYGILLFAFLILILSVRKIMQTDK